MLDNKNIFLQKKILIYGIGKSGLAAYKFLKKKNEVYLYDDNKINKNDTIKKYFLNTREITKKIIDFIIISPGIDINKCKLSKFLKKNLDKINTDLDIFYNLYYKNTNITITGTNGKSTTVKMLYEVLKQKKIDVRLVGNIGNPILSEKNISNKTIFVIEASSYQLEYSKLFKSNIAAIINISADHLERHRTIKNYINAKFKLIKNQTKTDYAILNTGNYYINKQLTKQKFKSKIIKIDKKLDRIVFKKLNNPYFMTVGNKENLLFVIEIAKIFKVKRKDLVQVLKKFNGLKYRQQIIFKSKNLTIINDSKATSFSSSSSVLKSLSNVFWIVGGQPKKGDKFLLSKNQCKTFKAYVFGKNKSFFIKKIRNVMKYESFSSLKYLIKKIFLDIEVEKNKTILFSPASASFDSFRNFEERGKYFNNLVAEFRNVKQ